ncbi:nitroreductase [Streptomonospora salina]|uniref:Nitroreductase n=1 Tax=Streptomonospora salina TaxID=104205 RepID=A0A841EAP7_9ACTN|nr:nitroreductase family protein [Streptomonospora salina]MBB6000076.1 nitroreductase [Streptomonospora salina]
MSSPTLPFSEAVRARRSARQFLPTPMSAADIRTVLEDAQTTPSNCNTQPWTVHVVSGEERDALSKEILRADDEGRSSSDFTFDYADFGQGAYLERAHHHAASLYEAAGVERHDKPGRKAVVRSNLEFFGAPHVAFLFMPNFGDNVRAASDIGMYAQTFLISLTARGYDGIPQTALGFHADVIRDFLGVPEELKLLFGISFGLADQSAPINQLRMGRVPVEENVVLHGITE